MTQALPFENLSDDETLKLFRNTMKLLNETSSEEDNIKKIAGGSAALFLINLAKSMNGKLTLNISDATVHTEKLGDWKVTVERADFEEEEEPPQILLGGSMSANKVDTAIDCFDKLTVLRIRTK